MEGEEGLGVGRRSGSRSYAVLTAATPQLIEFSC